MSRGNHQNEIFRDDGDCEIFLETLGQACARTGWIVHGYVLMVNHWHALIETPEANLSVGLRWLQSTYTQRFNRRHQECGHLLQGRYKALLIDPDDDMYFRVVSHYIHLNPARAKRPMLTEGALVSYGWSSFSFYVRTKDRPEWLCVADDYLEDVPQLLDKQNISFVQKGNRSKIKCDAQFIQSNRELLRQIAEYAKKTWQK